MDGEVDSLFWILVLLDSSVGAGVFIYAIRQKEPLYLVLGIVLSVLPMVFGTGVLLLLGTLITIIGFLIVKKLT